ncbi:CotH kinase family protein [Dyadobacter bucti]|uniref:CotH kinase family protein n=1 Tax=Dyadobacter bucti TaxID=2572203 RepID=UPI003F6F9053
MKRLLLGSFWLLTLILCKATAQPVQLTNLTTLYITTDENLPVDSKSTWRTGQLSIAASPGTEGVYSGPIEIRGRGNSTWELAKKPYRIRLASKYQLLGMPARERNWVLLANYADKTMMRNALAFEVSKFLGLPYSCPYRFVDVYLNNTFVGNYTLTDQIEVADERVEVEEQEDTDTEEPAITGGYLLEADGFADQEVSKFTTARGIKVTIKYPEDDEINTAQSNYISNYFQNIENALFSSDFQDPQNGYMKYMDKASLVNWYLACEITGNSDSFWSTYMFKKKNDEKIYFGPLWDFDIAFNNDERLGDATFKRMSTNGHFSANRVWIERMLQDGNFRAALSERWKQLKSAGLHSHFDGLITSMASTLAQSQVKNYEVWPTLNSKVYLEYNYSGSYNDQVEFLRDYLAKRLSWLELQITGELGKETYYKIVNKSTGKVLAPGSDPSLLVQKSFVQGDNTLQWALSNIESDGNKYYFLSNRASGRLISSSDNNTLTQLSLSTGLSGSQQQWQLIFLPDNMHFGLLNRANGMAMDNFNEQTDEGNKIIQFANNIYAASNQQWQIVPTEVNQSALPIYTSGLKATTVKNKILLSWEVYDEKGGSHFEIQRFSDPKKFNAETIGTVQLTDARTGSYKFTDENPLLGINYYRLKQVDMDGTITFSTIVSAKNTGIAQLSLWPVPTAGKANISFSSVFAGNGSLEVYNITGQKLGFFPFAIRNGDNNFSWDTAPLTQGMYLLKVNYGDEEEAVTLKLVKTTD